jgi:hypothetical protein
MIRVYFTESFEGFRPHRCADVGMIVTDHGSAAAMLGEKYRRAKSVRYRPAMSQPDHASVAGVFHHSASLQQCYRRASIVTLY